jgi:signal transduction histidine kinase
MVALRATWQRVRAVDQQRLDVAIALALAVAAVWDWHYSSDPLWRLPLQLGIAATVAFRRSHPLIAVVVAVACAVSLRVSPGGEGNAAILLNAYSVGRHAQPLWRASVVLAAVIAAIALITSAGAASLVVLMAAIVGVLVREQVSAAYARANEAIAAEKGAADERARIARDLHDIVAHAVSVMVVQAEAAKNMLHRDAGAAESSIDAISTSGREALLELRQLLQVLGDTRQAAPLGPSPVAGEIDQLVEGVRASGQPVQLHIEGNLGRLEPVVSQATYRIVQEALTNAVKYAQGAPTEVTVDFQAERVKIEVVDHGGGRRGVTAGSGRGLQGLKERVAILGGDFSASPSIDGGFAVRASLPCAHS